MNNAIGLVEVMGLAGAVDVSDVMLKAANVQLIGVERARGFGWMTVKIEGDVGAVKAAVDAGKAKAVTNNVFVSDLVIPRPATNLDKVFFKKEEKLVGAEPVGTSLAEAEKTDETFVETASVEEPVEAAHEVKPVEAAPKPEVKPAEAKPAAPAKKSAPAKTTPAEKQPEAAQPTADKPAAKKPAANGRRKTTRRTRKTNNNDNNTTEK